MRIENHVNTRIEPMKKENLGAQPKANFAQLVAQSSLRMQEGALQQLVNRIHDSGERLGKHMTMENLREYKKLVKQFLNEAVEYGIELQERQGFNSRGRPRSYKIVEEVDKKLIDLTNQILDDEKNQLEILSLVGDIKGLLINLYS
ncbi:YaaR family protein [Bacillus horti]|uniref:Uncharacterized protein YaaR (DUF327 family) n=1 Tax=Caldalkalibacillus horti TaxID=77523 RepID=A0ABT9VZE3_9BACI|nr:YaaR family protein [Bacillus horti]MDQ0166349.1 uncharacterized protein YaaR (DUF327 family) [Bacillus horti]